mmetsp:Transcript_8201/g.23473  ORF Transcript_8201/g.23473 Transcript_8201/m.23473 type:complete len:280 (+) Transcript_8201:454-1293(+)
MGIHRSHTMHSWPACRNICLMAETCNWIADCSSGGHAAKHGACFTGSTITWAGTMGPRAVAMYTSVVAVTIMCFSTCGLTRQNQQSLWGSMTICTSRFLPGPPVERSRGFARHMLIFLPAHSSISLRSQAAWASSGEEKVTQPKPLQGLPSALSSRARCMRSILPMCLSAASIRFSSMLGGRRLRNTWSGTTWPPSSPKAWRASSSGASRFTGVARASANGLGVVFAGRCLRAASGIAAAGLRAKPWIHNRPLPLLPTLPMPMQRQTCPRRCVWKGGRW